MVRAGRGLASSGREPRRAGLGPVDGLDLRAAYCFDRMGGDFFDVVRMGSRVLPHVSMPLGLFTHSTYDASMYDTSMYDTSMQAFEPGAALLLATKGVTRSMRGAVPFGADGLLEVLRSSTGGTARDVCRAALRAARRFEKRRWDWLAFWRPRVREDMTALAMVRSAEKTL